MVREIDLSLMLIAGLVTAGLTFSQRDGDGSP